MKTYKLFLLSLLIMTIYSCIPSLHGIVTDETSMTDDRILGTWSYENGMSKEIESSENHLEFSTKEIDYTFERAANITCTYANGGKTVFEGTTLSMLKDEQSFITSQELLPYYILTHREVVNQDTIISYFKVEMTKIQQHLWLDFLPLPQDEGVFAGHFATSYVLAHTFGTIDFLDGNIEIRPIDAEYIQKLITQKRIRLKHEQRKEDDIVLTASTRDLREFLNNYSDDENLLESADRLYPVQ